MKTGNIVGILAASAMLLSGCATIGDPAMIGPNTYTVVGDGVNNGTQNMHARFLTKMTEHCQSLGKYPLLRKDNFTSEVLNVFGDKSYNGSLIYQCVDATEYDKSKKWDEVMPIQRIEKRVVIERE